MKGKLIAVARNLTEQEKLEYEAKIRNVSAMYDEIAALTKKKEAIEETAKAAAKALAESAEANVKSLAKESNKTNKSMARHETAIGDLDAEAQRLRDDALANGTDNSTRLAQIEQERAAHVTALVEIRERASELAAELDDVATSYDLTEQEVKQLVESNG
jgi:chromosome segregation ATPase